MHGITQTSIYYLGNTHTQTHTRVETGCWYLGIKRRGHNVLMKGELGPHLVISWAQASQTPRDYHYPLDTHSHRRSALWGMCLEHMGNGDIGHTSAPTVIIPRGVCTHTHTHTRVVLQNPNTHIQNTSLSLLDVYVCVCVCV